LRRRVDNLRTRGHGATYDDPSPVKLAAFPGVEFDGQTVGPKHVFIPLQPAGEQGGRPRRRDRGDAPGIRSGSSC